MRLLLCTTIALTALACSDDGSSGEAEPGGSACSTSTLAPGDSMRTLMHDGVARTYLLHVPASYNGKRKVPLVVDMHGLTSNAAQQKAISGWVAKSDAEGFLLVHPDGLNSSWNGGTLCCGASQRDDVDDVGFMRAIVSELNAPACVDAARVYATGLSNGGAMAFRLACEASDVFAAAAPASMGNGTVPCTPARPTSVIMYRATGDTLVPYNGGMGAGFPPFPSAQADFDQWAMLNGCTGTPSRDGICQTLRDCNAGVEVTLCTVDSPASDFATLGGHVVYGYAADQGKPQPDVAWAAFARQPKPTE
jgi:polyhydroxybutyrate depolymerase